MLVVLEYLVGLGVGYLIIAALATKQFNHQLWPFKVSAPPPPRTGIGGQRPRSDGAPPAQP